MGQLFMRFAYGLFLILVLFGLGMTVVILSGDKAIGLRMVNAFTSMFVGVLGLGSGYILGRVEHNSRNGKEGNGQDRVGQSR
jgi:hypothetical protein